MKSFGAVTLTTAPSPAATWPASIAALKQGGRMAVCGMTSGNDAVVPVRMFYSKQVTMAGALLGTRAQLTGVVHVRDTLTAADQAPAVSFARSVFSLEADTTVHAALKAMRETRNHLAVLNDGGAFLGVITLSDVLRRLFQQPTTAAA